MPTTTGTDRWDAVHDERHWYEYTHGVEGDQLLVYQHTFRRVRMPAGKGRDHLLWKHHTTKLARRYPAGAWTKVSRAKKQTPPTSLENVARRPRHRKELG